MSETNYPLCANEKCARPMRPRGYTAEMAPGTVAMGHRGECKTCVQPKPRRKSATPPIARRKKLDGADVRAADTLSGLEAFYGMRYARGVKPEGVKLSSIQGKVDGSLLPARVTGPAIIYVPAPGKARRSQ